MTSFRFVRALIAAACMAAPVAAAYGATEQQTLEELRNTIVNLLQALVEQGVMSREKAADLVRRAQEKATADTQAMAKAEEGAIRVPYVPQIVRDEISKQVAEEVRPVVVSDVVQRAKDERWGVPGAMPEWLARVRIAGDVIVRGQEDLFGHGNAAGYYLDYASINAAGGIAKAGDNVFLNTTEDRERLRMRARLGVEVALAEQWSAGIRLSTGALQDPSSESQNVGGGFGRYTVGFDRAYLRWDAPTDRKLSPFTMASGRIANPWFTPTELVWARDVSFDGLALTGRVGLGGDREQQSHVFATIGGFPVQEQPLVFQNDKWLVGGQLGVALQFAGDQRLRVAAAYYDFIRAEGMPNSFQSTLTNYSAPPFIRFGNTYFDISNSTDPTVNLFALASRFHIADLAASYELPTNGRYVFVLNAEAVRNVGFSSPEILARTGLQLPARNKGYVSDVRFGDPAVDRRGAWRAALGYRYVQSDAVLDALTDADFHTGGTNVKGYYLWGELGLARDVWLRLRYMAGDVIDGPPFALDVIQFDLNTKF
jgi:hypothetical protein